MRTLIPASLLVWFAACPGPSNSNLDAGTFDGGMDAGLDASFADAGNGADAFVTATHRSFPPIPEPNGGLLSPMTLVSIVASNDADLDALFQFGDAVVGGTWFPQVTAQYGVAAPVTHIKITGPAITANLATADLLTYIQTAIATAAPPNGNSLYVLYVPAGIQVTDAYFCAFHEAYPDGTTTLGDDWAAVTRCGPFTGGETSLQAVTRIASHEIAEAATDPNGLTLTYGTTPANPPQASVWASFENQGWVEAGDLCEGTRIILATGDAGWEYQRIWSNQQATLGNDPCAPPSPQPYFSVSVPRDWYAGAPGTAVPIPITGWSVASRGTWGINVDFINSSLGFQGQDGGFWSAQSQLGSIQLGPGCNKHPGMNNGTTGSLTVNVPTSTASGDWAVFMIISFEEDPSTCYPYPDRDDYHFWLVGVYVP